MSKETRVEPPCFQENPDDDENIPPEVSVSAKKVQVTVGEYSPAQSDGENQLLSETSTSSTPAPGSGKWSRISGLQSALTPILKYLNIANRRPSLEHQRCESIPQKTTGGSSQHPMSGMGAYGGWMQDEYFPEITLLDVTGDVTMQMLSLPHSLPATPGKATSGALNNTISHIQSLVLRTSSDALEPLPNVSSAKAERVDADKDKAGVASTTNIQKAPVANQIGPNVEVQNINMDSCSAQSSITVFGEAVTGPQVSTALTNSLEYCCDLNLPKLSKQNGKAAISEVHTNIPNNVQRAVGFYLPEITLLEMTRDSDESPERDMSAMEVTQGIPSVNMVEDNRLSSAQSDGVDVTQGEDKKEQSTSNNTELKVEVPQASPKTHGSMNSTFNVKDGKSTNLNVGDKVSSPQDNTLNFCPPCVSNTTLDCVESQISAELKNTSDPALVLSQSSSGAKTNSDVQNATFDGHSLKKSSGNSTLGEAGSGSFSLQNTFDCKPDCKKNGTITMSESPCDTQTIDSKPICQNGTITLSESSCDSRISDSNPISKKTGTVMLSESSCDTHAIDSKPICQNGTITLSRSSCDTQTIDSKPLHQNGTIMLSRSSCDTQTIDSKPICQNGTITLSESSCDSHISDSNPICKKNSTATLSETQTSVATTVPLQESNPTKDHQDSTADVQCPELLKENGTERADSKTKMVASTESTFVAKAAVEAAPGAGSQSLSGLSDSMGHQGVDGDDDKANTFNFDDMDRMMDMKSEPLYTSTPMPHCKMFPSITESMEDKIIWAQKRLYKDPISLDAPSNIVSDRKTFLTQAPKALLPPLKAASQLLKYKAASTQPGRGETFTNPPTALQKTQTEAPRAAQGIPATSICYNLRATTTGARQPISALPRPTGLPPGIQRSVTGLRPPVTRRNVLPANTDKLCGPASVQSAAVPVTKTVQAKKHNLTRGETLPTSKKKKLEASAPSSAAAASTSAIDAVNRGRNLRALPTAHRAVTVKAQSDETAVPTSTAETPVLCNAGNRTRNLKQTSQSFRSQLTKPQGHGCAKCIALEGQLKLKSEEIRRLKEELQKYTKMEEC